jgi:hypothetical protein
MKRVGPHEASNHGSKPRHEMNAIRLFRTQVNAAQY